MDSMLTSRAQGLLPQTEQHFAISLLPLRNKVHIKDMPKQVTNGSSHFRNDFKHLTGLALSQHINLECRMVLLIFKANANMILPL